MGDISFYTVCFLFIFGFFAAFVDSVVGGGGLISIPALLFVGLPPSTAIATNKLASTTGSLTSTITFIKAGKVNFSLVFKLFPLTFIGALLGAFVVKHISSEILKPLVLCLLILVAVYTILKKDWGKTSNYQGMSRSRSVIFALVVFIIGFYDGFFGAGTGSLLLFAFLIIGFDFIQSAGNAKVLNFGSNIAALIMFLCLGLINFSYGIIMGIAMFLGALVGSKFAIKKGVSYVRVLFIIVTLFLIGKNILDYIHII